MDGVGAAVRSGKMRHALLVRADGEGGAIRGGAAQCQEDPGSGAGEAKAVSSTYKTLQDAQQHPSCLGN
ncbi:hypothetical protein NDU88_001161 [Pleurodeles waltl]|uniref:Uncharacterized protein n=1 Tax=Pleurodeles waltl TaxID=8319 RepID=A0AAV7S7A0_PLEWA|nr:hypothetical protein NDU88_001161 [Pleurodeles waltl]